MLKKNCVNAAFLFRQSKAIPIARQKCFQGSLETTEMSSRTSSRRQHDVSENFTRIYRSRQLSDTFE